MNLEMSIAEKLAETGLCIKDPLTFAGEADSVNLDDLLDKFSALKRKMNSSANIVDFAKTIGAKLDEIESIINSDDYSRLSDSVKMAYFNNDMRSVRKMFEKVQNYIKSESNMQFHKQNMFDVMRKIYELGKNKSISDSERTSETLKLYGQKKACEEAYNKAYQFYNEQRKAYNDSVRSFSLVDFKNELLQHVNSLQISINALALAPESKDKLQALISDTRNEVAYYGLESIRSKTEFDSLCKRFGIGVVEERKLSDEKVTQKQPEIEEVVNISNDLPKPEVERPSKENDRPATAPTIEERMAEVLEQLKKLNPGVEFKMADAIDKKFDGRIESSIPSADLHLPEDFYHINNGISNKFSSDSAPVIIEVGELEKEKEISDILDEIADEPIDTLGVEDIPEFKEEPTIEANETEERSFFDAAKDYIARLTKKGKVEGGKKLQVTRSRKAIIGSYGKTLLTFSALSTVGLGIAGSPLVPAALVGAGFGAIAQTLYRKVVKNTDARIDTFEGSKYEDTPENAPVLVGLWHKASDALMNIYKKRKTGEIKTNNDVIALSGTIAEDLENSEVRSAGR